MDDQFAAVNELQTHAKSERQAGNLEAAVALLEDAAAALESSYGRCDQDAPPTEIERYLASELAETYGLLGGTHRQRGDLYKAVEAYNRGRSFEVSDRYELGSTYASLNWVVASVLADPASLESGGEVTTELQWLRRVLAEHETRLEAFDPWAEGDLALAKVLGGESGDDAWEDFLKMAPDYAVDAYAGTVARLAELDTPRRASLVASLTALRRVS